MGLDVLASNPIINSRTTSSNPALKEIANATGKLLGDMLDVTYYPDNPLLRTNPQLLDDYAAGEYDDEVAARLMELAAQSKTEILRLQQQIRSSSPEAGEAARELLKAHVEVLKYQIQAATHFVAEVRSDDVQAATALHQVFDNLQTLLYEIQESAASEVHMPEVIALRKAMLETQDEHAIEKPVLNTALVALRPKSYHAQLAGMASKLPSPHTGAIDAELLGILNEYNSAFASQDSLFESDTFRKDWQKGLEIDSISVLYQAPMERNIEFLKTSFEEMAGLSYGVQLLDLQHAYRRGIELLRIATNAMFELMDTLPGDISESPGLEEWMHTFSDSFEPIAQQPELADMRNLIASWNARWPLRPVLTEKLNKSLEVARLEMAPVRAHEGYAVGDAIVSVIMLAGKLATVRLESGRLPIGMQLNNQGQIVVSEPAKLLAGRFTDLVLAGTNDLGATFELAVPEIVIGHDIESIYYVVPNIQIAQLTEGQPLAYPIDPDGNIVEAQVTLGNLPRGIRFNTTKGIFEVADPSKLKVAVHTMEVTTIDLNGGTTRHTVVLDLKGMTIGTIYVPKQIDITLPVSTGQVVGELNASGVSVVNPIMETGMLPAGLAMNFFGSIYVTSPSLVTEQVSYCEIRANGADGKTYIFQVTFIIQVAELQLPPQYSVITVKFSGMLPIATGTNLGNLNPTAATLVSVTPVLSSMVPMPSGVGLTSQGMIYVTNGAALTMDDSVFLVRTEDNTGLVTFYLVYLYLKDLAGLNPDPGRLIVEFLNVPLPQTAGSEIGQVEINDLPLVACNVLGWSLPQGITLQNDGSLVVENPGSLYLGKFAFLIAALAEDQLWYQVEVRITFTGTGPIPGTHEMLYKEFLGIELPFVLDEVLGVISFPGLPLLSVWIEGGTLPNDVDVLSDGTIKATAIGTQVPGIYELNARGEVDSDTEVVIIVRIELLPAVPIELERQFMDIELPIFTGEVIGTIVVTGVTLSNFEFMSGDMPTNAELTADGIIMALSGQGREPDTFVFFASADGSDFNIYHFEVTVQYEDQDYYPFNQEFLDIELPLTNGAIIGLITAPTEGVNHIEQLPGSFPSGLSIDSSNRIVVSNASSLTDGTFYLNIVCRGNTSGNGLTGQIMLEMYTGPLSESCTLGLFELPGFIDDTVGTIDISGMWIDDATIISGALPPNMEMGADGIVTVVAGQNRYEDTFYFDVDCMAQDGRHYVVHVTLPLADKETDTPFDQDFLSIPIPQPLGTVLGQIRPTGEALEQVELLPGYTLPPGVALHLNGNLVVLDPDDLRPGESDFMIVGRGVSSGTAYVGSIYTLMEEV
jgi:hypothetical protein